MGNVLTHPHVISRNLLETIFISNSPPRPLLDSNSPGGVPRVQVEYHTSTPESGERRENTTTVGATPFTNSLVFTGGVGPSRTGVTPQSSEGPPSKYPPVLRSFRSLERLVFLIHYPYSLTQDTFPEVRRSSSFDPSSTVGRPLWSFQNLRFLTRILDPYDSSYPHVGPLNSTRPRNTTSHPQRGPPTQSTVSGSIMGERERRDGTTIK